MSTRVRLSWGVREGEYVLTRRISQWLLCGSLLFLLTGCPNTTSTRSAGDDAGLADGARVAPNPADEDTVEADSFKPAVLDTGRIDGTEVTGNEVVEQPAGRRYDLDLVLTSGYLGANEQLSVQPSQLYTCEQTAGSNPQFLLQVAARIEGVGVFDPELTRVEFTSNGSEWVSQNGAGVYGSEAECVEAGGHCDEVVVAEGVSGLFSAGGGWLAIQNLYCRYWGGSAYSFTVTAQAFDLNPWPIEPLTEPASIAIHCLPKPCCPDADYIETYGNHTTEEWECE